MLFVMDDFRREKREKKYVKGKWMADTKIVGDGFVMLHFARSKPHSTYRTAPSSLGPRTLKNLELETSRLEASADCRIQGDT